MTGAEGSACFDVSFPCARGRELAMLTWKHRRLARRL